MEIIDIQPIKQGISEKFEITFGNDVGYDIAKITISKEDMWQIAEYCHDKLSYGAQLRKKALDLKRHRRK